jgi:hypothetical protein
MYIIGVDYHPSFQQIAFLDQETGECGERRLDHSDGERRKNSFQCMEKFAQKVFERTDMVRDVR